jgi:hypothetical protein
MFVTVAAGVLALTAVAAAQAPPKPERVPITADKAVLSKMVPGVGPPSRKIFMNGCRNGGCQIFVGQEDSRRNRSTVARSTSVVPEFPYSDAVWEATLQCVRETYGAFDIEVTDVDPCPDHTSGCTEPHWEIIVAGQPSDISYPNNAGGVSPFDFQDCSIIENSITYAFAEVMGDDPNVLCYVIAQETAHSFGLDHEYLAEDPMTYIPQPSRKRFQNVLADCGEGGPRQCYCGRNRQNSVQEILDIFGAAPPSPPIIEIISPTPGQAVEPGFRVTVDIDDAQGLQQVELLIDGAVTTTLTTPPFAFNAPADIAEGGHLVEVRAVDLAGTPGSADVEVLVGGPCERPSDCETLGENYTCVGGRCVPGPGSPGGLGESCDTPADCVSGLCATKDAENHCAEPCAPGSNQCPGGFSCLDDGAGGGLCWPGESGGCLGCTTGGGGGRGTDPLVPIAAGLVIAVLLVRRRRVTVADPRN